MVYNWRRLEWPKLETCGYSIAKLFLLQIETSPEDFDL